MGVRLRVVLDQLVQIIDADQASAALDLTHGLIATAPAGCAVDAIVTAGATPALAGIEGVHSLALGRRELAVSWQLGLAPGVGGGLIHAPSLMAPLVRHDRVHDHDQTTVTVWDLRAWQAPETLPKGMAAWQRSMLRRAVRHADAVVVPSHAMAAELGEIARLGDRIRVIAGAAPDGFATVGGDHRALALPERYAVLVGNEASLVEGFRGAVAADLDAVVIDAAEGGEPRLAEIASAAGLPERRVHVRASLPPSDRAEVLGGAVVFVATDPVTAWPWRVVEAMTLGIPIVAADSGTHRDVIADGGLLVDRASLAAAVAEAATDSADRLGVLAADRSRAFSWASAAERVWSLHAEL